MTEQSLAELGERALVARLVALLPPVGVGVSVAAGGDDAAVAAWPGGDLVLTADLLVEGVHFRSDAPPDAVGHRALAASLSDLAAMGAKPVYAMVTLALPRSAPAAWAEDVYRGLGRLAARTGTSVVGGDTVESPGPAVLDVFAVGRVEPGRAFRADSGRPGDVVCATGVFGLAAAGLAVLEGKGGGCTGVSAAVSAHLYPEPRLAVAAALQAAGLTPACRDASDGLAAAARLVAAASGCGVELEAEAVPLPAVVDAVARAAGADPLDWALYGGEDYELVMALPPAQVAAARAVATACGVALTPVGRLLAEPGAWLIRGGRRLPLGEGYRAFAGG